MAEVSSSPLRGQGIRYLIEEDLLGYLRDDRDPLRDRVAQQQLLDEAAAEVQKARDCADADQPSWNTC